MINSVQVAAFYRFLVLLKLLFILICKVRLLTVFCSRDSYSHLEFQMDRAPIPRTVPGTVGPTDWNEALDIISYGSPEQVFFCSLLFSLLC